MEEYINYNDLVHTVDLDQAGIGDMTLCTVGMSLRSCNKIIDLYQNMYMYNLYTCTCTCI